MVARRRPQEIDKRAPLGAEPAAQCLEVLFLSSLPEPSRQLAPQDLLLDAQNADPALKARPHDLVVAQPLHPAIPLNQPPIHPQILQPAPDQQPQPRQRRIHKQAVPKRAMHAQHAAQAAQLVRAQAIHVRGLHARGAHARQAGRDLLAGLAVAGVEPGGVEGEAAQALGAALVGLAQRALDLLGDAARLGDDGRDVEGEEGEVLAEEEDEDGEGREPEHVCAAAARDLPFCARQGR